jgi:hypothetical protein
LPSSRLRTQRSRRPGWRALLPAPWAPRPAWTTAIHRAEHDRRWHERGRADVQPAAKAPKGAGRVQPG